MKIYLSKSTNPYENLALDEAFLRSEKEKEGIVYIYQNDNAIIIGRNQNAYAEINEDYVKQHKIRVSRRISGGGAVYHDLGNVNFSFITYKSEEDSFRRFLVPIIEFLNSLGLDAKFKGRNDIVANECKISGNAQYIYKDRIMHHGTLLFDTDLTVLSKALNVNKIKLESKAVESVRQRVSNIKELLSHKIETNEFIKQLINFFENKGAQKFVPSNEILEKAKEICLVNSQWEWNYGQSPIFKLNNTNYFVGAGLITASLNVEHGKISDIKIYGDFLAKNNTQDIVKHLIGIEFTKEAILKVLSNYPLEDYFGKLTKEQIADTIIGTRF